VVFLIYERLKGELSFWHPYFEVVHVDEMTCHWDSEVLKKCDCPEMSMKLRYDAFKLDEDFEEIQKVVDLYPQFFPGVQFNRGIFNWAMTFSSQRCFGWGLASTSLAPLCD
jgi:hypothetical protein